MAVAAGTRLGRYEIISPLGAGGMAEVYLARDTQLGRRVALKLLPEDFTRNKGRLRRFEQEARTASALNHPNILTIHEIGQSEGRHFIATEFIDGLTLRQYMKKRGRMELGEVLDVAVQVAAALDAAHEAGIVHRDIKPENIMLRRDGYVKVLDFGIAKLTEKRAEAEADDSKSEGVSRGRKGSAGKLSDQESASEEAPTIIQDMADSGIVQGTVKYMSPEQARGLSVDARTDIFSLGVVIYRMLTGRLPFEGSSDAEMLMSILVQEPAPLEQHAKEAPLELQGIVTRALAKSRQQRYQTIRELILDLKSLKEELEFRTKLQSSTQARAGGVGAAPIADRSGGVETQAGAGSDATSRVNPAARKTTGAYSHNLPAQPTPLIGRKREVDAVKSLLRRDDVRLLNLTGPGGTGKTRLGLQSALDLAEEFESGVHFVSLASIRDAGLVASTISQTLQIKEGGGGAINERLKEFLRERQMLLLLDNFEQVARAAPLVAELLEACPRLKVLVTSRAVLRLRGEHEFPVPPLALPDTERLPTVADLSRCAAVELFVARAQAVRPGFALTEENARAVAEICKRLDGLPLAIELAAARIKLLPSQTMLERLESRLKLLTGGAQDLPQRQQTMREAIAWSYDLLDEAERRLFRRLAVFVGGATLEAAEAICSDCGLQNADCGIEDLRSQISDFKFEISEAQSAIRNPNSAIEVLDGIASLIDKSLLRQEEEEQQQTGVEPRFAMLETIREYGVERLKASGEAEGLRRRHANFFLTLAEKAEPELTGPEQVFWLNLLEREHDNLRAALQHLIEEGSVQDAATRLGGALWRFWYAHGHLSEGRRWLDAALEKSSGLPAAARAKALGGAGVLARTQGNYERALALLEESVALRREIGDTRGTASALNSLGNVALEKGDYAQAKNFYEESLVLRREIGEKGGIASLLSNLGLVALHQDDHERAAALYNESLNLQREIGDRRSIAISLNNLGNVSLSQGDHAQAARLHAESLALYREAGDKEGIACALEGLMGVACAEGTDERAARLAGTAEALRARIGAPLPPSDRTDYDRNVAALRARLGQEAFDAAQSQGRAIPLEQAIAEELTKG